MSLSCLVDPTVDMVADASTLLSLNGTGAAKEILVCLPQSMVVTNVTLAELREDRRTGRNDAELVQQLVSADLIKIVHLQELVENHFEHLVIGNAIDTLDDGEAATIAWAIEKGSTALIDERKANRICSQKFPTLTVGCTIDLFAHNAVLNHLGREPLRDAVFNALRQARMRVPSHYLKWVVDLIGYDRVKTCPSIVAKLSKV